MREEVGRARFRADGWQADSLAGPGRPKLAQSLEEAGWMRLGPDERLGGSDVLCDGGEQASEAEWVRFDSVKKSADSSINGPVNGGSFSRKKEHSEHPSPYNQTNSPWLWNEGAERLHSLDASEVARRLTREGFVVSQRTSSPGHVHNKLPGTIGRQGARCLLVSLFGLEVIDIRPALGQRPRDAEASRRLARASARALTALGLDSGCVEWELDISGRRGSILALSPLWPKEAAEEESFHQRLIEAAAAFSDAWSRESREDVSVQLGADPEFVLMTPEGKAASAARYFSPSGRTGCDSVVVEGVRRWPLVELRPEPAADPLALTYRIRQLLEQAASREGAASLVWRSGTAPLPGLPLGGHLHISGAYLSGERLRALDNAVALPLRLLEPPGAGRRRPRYGALGDFRPKSHGGFEYRTPPSWLTTPRLAAGTLALAKVAAEHARELAGHRPLDCDLMRDAFYQGDRKKLLEGWEQLFSALAVTEGYKRYRSEIDPLAEEIRAGRVWDEKEDFRPAWGIPVTSVVLEPSRRSVPLKSQ